MPMLLPVYRFHAAFPCPVFMLHEHDNEHEHEHKNNYKNEQKMNKKMNKK
jgi:hypothetical protein